MAFEAAVIRAIKDELTKRGAWVYKTHGSAYSMRGAPDILACYPDGRFVALEVKQPGRRSRATPLQKYHLRKIREAGGVGAVVTSVEEALDAIAQPC